MNLTPLDIQNAQEVPMAEFFDPNTADFSPIFTKVKENGSQYLMVILSHAASDVFVFDRSIDRLRDLEVDRHAEKDRPISRVPLPL